MNETVPHPFPRKMTSIQTVEGKIKRENSLSTRLMNEVLVEAELCMVAEKSSFGASKYGKSLERKYRSSVTRYGKVQIPNLYGIVLPSGMGKTTLSRRYGLIDPDNILSESDYNDLVDIRRANLAIRKPDWRYHNDVWYSKCRNVLSYIEFSEARIILCHTEEFCLEIGAHPICAITTESDLGLKIENGRDAVDYRFGMINRRLVRDHTIACRIHKVQEFLEIERLVVGYAMQYVAIPRPYGVYDFAIKPVGYCNAPSWVLTGAYSEHTLSEVEKLHDRGIIPDCVLQHSMEGCYGLVSDVGIFNSTSKWLKIIHLIESKMGRPQEFEIPQSYPHRSTLEGDRAGIKLVDVVNIYSLMEDPVAKLILAHHVGSSHTLITGILVYYATVVKKLRVEIRNLLIKSRLLLIPEKDFSSVNKEAYTFVRVAKEFMGVKLDDAEQRNLMYIHTLTGRKLYSVDPTGEIVNRTRARKPYLAYDGFGWSHNEYVRQRENGIAIMYRKASGAHLRRMDTFLDFWMKRSEYVPKGSTVLSEDFEKKYALTVMVDGIVKEVERRHNKKSLFEQDGIYELMADLIVKRWGTNRSKAVPKMNEIGAERVLFPGELIQYVVMACAYFSFADLFPIGSTNLFTITQEHIYKYDLRLRDTIEGMLGCGNWTKDKFFCFDFKDFNSQHTIEDMVAITNGLLKHAPTQGDFLQMCFSWLEDSYHNMKILDSSGVEHDISQGLYSGWIFTMLMNCMCNDVYHSIANQTCLNMFGKTMLSYREGLGDDSASRVKSIEYGCIMYDVLVRIGYEASSIKQLFGGTMEFLRVMYSRGGRFGSCLCRIIATFVSGNLEHEPISIRELIKTRYEVIELMYNRGMDMEDCDKLWECCMNRWGRVKTNVGWTKIHDTVLHATKECGGFAIPNKEGDLYILDEIIPDTTLTVNVVVPGKLAALDRVNETVKILHRMGVTYKANLDDVDRIAKDSYDTQQIVDHIIADSSDHHAWTKGYNIIGRVATASGNINLGLAYEFFSWLERDDESLVCFARFEQYKLYVGVKLEELEVACGNYDFVSAAKFSPAAIHYPRVPEYFKTHFTEFVLAGLLRRTITLEQGYNKFADLCATMNEVIKTGLGS